MNSPETITKSDDNVLPALGPSTQQLLKKALIIGGAIAVGYVAYRQLTGKKKSGVLNSLVMATTSVLTTEKGRQLLLAGKDKLTQFLSKEG